MWRTLSQALGRNFSVSTGLSSPSLSSTSVPHDPILGLLRAIHQDLTFVSSELNKKHIVQSAFHDLKQLKKCFSEALKFIEDIREEIISSSDNVESETEQNKEAKTSSVESSSPIATPSFSLSDIKNRLRASTILIKPLILVCQTFSQKDVPQQRKSSAIEHSSQSTETLPENNVTLICLSIAAIQRLIGHDTIAESELPGLLMVLKVNSRYHNPKIQLKLLQTIPLLVNIACNQEDGKQVSDGVAYALLTSSFGICFEVIFTLSITLTLTLTPIINPLHTLFTLYSLIIKYFSRM